MTAYKSLILQWIRKLRSRRNQGGEFEYKPLLILAVLEILDKNPEHSNSFQYEELFEAFKGIAAKNSWEIDEQQFAHPYIRLKNDKQPIQIWIPQAIEGIDLERYETVYPSHVKRDVPSIKINDHLWEDFQNRDDRASFEQEIEHRLSFPEDSEELPLFSNPQLEVDPEPVDKKDLITNSAGIYHEQQEVEEALSSHPPSFKKVDDESDQSEYSLLQLAEETNIEISQLEKWIRIISRKKQVIFYGPPGTGKTFISQCLAKYLVGGRRDALDLIQFHPSYTYEDFIQGVRPVVSGGLVEFRSVDGRFVEFCKEAAKNKNLCRVLIIDEINRANLSNVFGELMYLLEYRDGFNKKSINVKSRISLPGGEEFGIPKNVNIIGTMNTADRSIALVDYALRRRFAFIELYPDYDLLIRYHKKIESDFPIHKLTDILKKLNRAIGDRNYEIGVSFFMDKDLSDNLEDIWVYEIEPYLEEYFFGQSMKIENFRWNKVSNEITK